MKKQTKLKQTKLKLNTLIDIEETMLRLQLKQPEKEFLRLQFLINFRPNASLRQINNQRKLNFG